MNVQCASVHRRSWLPHCTPEAIGSLTACLYCKTLCLAFVFEVSAHADACSEVERDDGPEPAEPAAAEPAGPAVVEENSYVVMLYKKRCIAAVRKKNGNQVFQVDQLSC